MQLVMRGAVRASVLYVSLLVFATAVLMLPAPGEATSGSRKGRAKTPKYARGAVASEPIVTLSPSVKANNTTFTITATATSATFVAGMVFDLYATDDPDDVSVSNVSVTSSTVMTASVTIANGAADQWVTMKILADATTIVQRAAFRIDGTDTSTNVSFSDAIDLAPTGSQQSITLYSPDSDFASGDTVATDNGNITIDTVTYVDSDHLDVDLTVGTSATLGDVKVSVSNGGTKKATRPSWTERSCMNARTTWSARSRARPSAGSRAFSSIVASA